MEGCVFLHWWKGDGIDPEFQSPSPEPHARDCPAVGEAVAFKREIIAAEHKSLAQYIIY